MTGEASRPVRLMMALLLAASVPLLGARLFVGGAPARCVAPAVSASCCCPAPADGCPPSCCRVGPGQPLPDAVLADGAATEPGAAPAALDAGVVAEAVAGASAAPRVTPRARSAPLPLFVLNAALLI